MPDININGFNFVTQAGTTEPQITNNVVFPAGHIIQTTINTYSAENSDTYANTSAYEIVNKSNVQSWKGTITNVLANNHVHIKMNFNLLAQSSNREDIGYSFAIYRESSQIYGGTNNNQTYMYFSGADHGTNQSFTLHNIEFIDTSPATGTNNYFLGFKCGTNTTISIVSASPTHTPYECILQEVAQ